MITFRNAHLHNNHANLDHAEADRKGIIVMH